MNFVRFIVQVFIIFLLLLLLGLLIPPAIILPHFSTTTVVLQFIAWLVLIAIIGYFLGRSVDTIKGPLLGMAFAFLAAILLGIVLALFLLLDITSAPQLNFHWLENDAHWYDHWLAILLIGALLLLPFLSPPYREGK